MTHKVGLEEITKIRCTTSDATRLITQLHADIKELSGRWPIGEESFQQATTSDSEWYCLFLLFICYQPKNVEEPYKEMLDECRAYYQSSPCMLEQIKNFVRTNEADNAICEYTRSSFLYPIVNRALRTKRMEIVTKFSPFISDLHSQIYRHHNEYYRSNAPPIRGVYRGQYLSVDELEYLSSACKSRNRVITLTTFGSASLSPGRGRIACLFEIIITDENDTVRKHIFRRSPKYPTRTKYYSP